MKNTGPSTRSVLGASGLLLIFSFFFSYWEASLANSSQAGALQLSIYITHADGPLCERLAPDDLARLENSTRAAAILALALLALATALAARPAALLLCLPAMLLPAVVCADATGILTAGASAPPGGVPAELATRLGTGTIIAWCAAALLAGAALRELWKFASGRLPRTMDPG